MNNDLIICRCEEITVGEIREAIRSGATSLTGIKRRVRAGMGLCQGRTCESLVTRILAEEIGNRSSEIEPASIRPPVTAITFATLAGEHHE